MIHLEVLRVFIFRTTKLFCNIDVNKEAAKSVEQFLKKNYSVDNNFLECKWAVRSSGKFLILLSAYFFKF